MNTVNLQQAIKAISNLPTNTFDMASKGIQVGQQMIDFISKSENQLLIAATGVGFMLQPLYFVAGAAVGYKGTEYAQNMLSDRFKLFALDSEKTLMNGIQKGIKMISGKPTYLVAAAAIGMAHFGYLPIFAKGSFMLAAAIGNHVFLNATSSESSIQ